MRIVECLAHRQISVNDVRRHRAQLLSSQIGRPRESPPVGIFSGTVKAFNRSSELNWRFGIIDKVRMDFDSVPLLEKAIEHFGSTIPNAANEPKTGDDGASHGFLANEVDMNLCESAHDRSKFQFRHWTI